MSVIATPFDEMYAGNGSVRPHYRLYRDWLAQRPPEEMAQKRQEADLLFRRVGITFAVYGDEAGAERLIPFDTIPRMIPASEWSVLERGLRQRALALNLFLHDIYHERNILKAGVIPADIILKNADYQQAMIDVTLPNQVYAHIAGIDLVRGDDGTYY